MENNIKNQQNQFQEEEIDIMALVKRLWEKKSFIIKVTCVFAVFGLIVALTTPKEYTASCVVVPETKGGAFSSSSLGGLAAIAGFNIGASSSADMLSPNMYTSLMKNFNLCKELVNTSLNFKEFEDPVTILEYYTNKDYQKFSLAKTIKKYTIGLPSVILGIFRSKQDTATIREKNIGEPYNLHAYTTKEKIASTAILQQISIEPDQKLGSVKIMAYMPDPIAAAQLVNTVQTLLQKYVIELKLQKAEINYNFIKERYEEAKKIFDEKQEIYAKFQDSNKSLSTALSKVKGEQIKSEFEVASSLFNQLTVQLIQAEMKVKEDIPILTVVEPVTVPLYKSSPNVFMILVVSIFLGCMISCVLVFGLDWLRSSGIEIGWFNKL